MRADRLLKLADFLETVPRKKFDINGWGYEDTKCGFAGCAMGWAGHAKLFRGLTFSEGGLHYAPNTDLGGNGFAIAEQLFDLGGRGSRELFSATSYEESVPTPKIVAKRIRKFVKDNSPVAKSTGEPHDGR